MKFETVETLAAFESLAAEWNALLPNSVTNVPFLRHEYARAWWATLGGGEWPSAGLKVVTGRAPSGRLVGVAPFFRLTDGMGPALHLLGSFEVSDYLDLLVSPDEAPSFVSGLVAFLAEEPESSWRVLDLYNLPSASPVRPLMLESAARQGWRAIEEPLQPCPVISLPHDWDGYLQSLDKKQRHELRRKLRRAQEQPPGAQLRWVDRPEEIERAMQAFLHLMRLDPQKMRFLTEAMESHFRSLAEETKHEGWLRLAFLDIGEEPAAGYLVFDYDNRLWIYNSCLNPAFRELSPGWVLTGLLIQWAIEQARDEVDFLRGGEAYKYQLGGVARTIFRVRVERNPG